MNEMNKIEILKAEQIYQDIIREYGYENWANSNMHNNPESIAIMCILKKIIDIEKKLSEEKQND